MNISPGGNSEVSSEIHLERPICLHCNSPLSKSVLFIMYSTGLEFPDAIHTFLELKSSEMSCNIKVIEHSSCNSLDLIFPVVRGTFRSASKIGVEWANFFCKEPDNKYFRLCESYRFNSHKSSHGQYVNERTELCAYKNRQRARSGPQAMVCQPL